MDRMREKLLEICTEVPGKYRFRCPLVCRQYVPLKKERQKKDPRYQADDKIFIEPDEGRLVFIDLFCGKKTTQFVFESFQSHHIVLQTI